MDGLEDELPIGLEGNFSGAFAAVSFREGSWSQNPVHQVSVGQQELEQLKNWSY